MWIINAPQGRLPGAIFTKIYRVCTLFQYALAVKASLDLLKGLWSYGCFNLTGSGYPKFSVPPSGETMRQTPNISKVKKVLEVLYHHVKVGGIGFHAPPGRRKTLTFLSVRQAFEQFVRPISP